MVRFKGFQTLFIDYQLHIVSGFAGAAIEDLVQRIREAKLPTLLVGMRASSERETRAIRQLVAKTGLPVVETFQGAGIISRELEKHFFWSGWVIP